MSGRFFACFRASADGRRVRIRNYSCSMIGRRSCRPLALPQRLPALNCPHSRLATYFVTCGSHPLSTPFHPYVPDLPILPTPIAPYPPVSPSNPIIPLSPGVIFNLHKAHTRILLTNTNTNTNIYLQNSTQNNIYVHTQLINQIK